MHMDREQDTFVSRRMLFAAPAAVLAGSALASIPVVAAPAHGDALLLETWVKLKEVLKQNDAINARIEAQVDDIFAVVGPIPEGISNKTLTDAEFIAFKEERDGRFRAAIEQHPDKTLSQEQAQLEDEIAPLSQIMRNAVPITLAGIAAKASFLRAWDTPPSLWDRDAEELEPGDLAVRDFIDRLAALA